MATQTPKINLQKPVPNVEVDWAFRLNESLDTLDDAMLTANVSGVGSITVTDDGSGNVTISGEAAGGGGGGGSNALVGSDGITVTSGDPTDTISGFRGEFVNASGILQTDIDTNTTNIATNVSDIADNTTLITTTSGHLQGEIDAVEAGDVDSINAVAGAVLVTGTNGVNTSTVGQTITISSVDSELDHGSIGGLSDDDHTQYILTDGTRAFTGDVTIVEGFDLTTSGVITFADGLFGTPALVFASDTDTGIYKHGNNDLGISAGGLKIARFLKSGSVAVFRPFGEVHFTDGSAADPQITFVSESNTGIYRKAEAVIGVSGKGVEVLTISGTALGTKGVGIVGDLTVTGTVQAGGQIITKDSTGSTDLAIGPSSEMGFAFNDSGNIINIRIADSGTGWFDFNRIVYKGFRSSNSSTASPALSFFFDTNTGIHWPTEDILSFVTGGVEAGFFDASQNFHANADVLASGTVSGTAGSFSGPVEIFGGESDLTMGDGGSVQKPQILGHPNSAGLQAAFAFVGDTGTGMYRHAAGTIRFATEGNVPLELKTLSVKTLAPLWLNTGSGDESAPVLAFNSDTNTGLFQNVASDGSIAFSANGTRAGYFDKQLNLHVTNDVRSGGTVSGTTIKAGDGTQALPSITFASDTDTGMYLDAANQAFLVANGARRFRWNANNLNSMLQHLFIDNPASAPGIAFASDPNTGIYQNSGGDGSVAFSTDGTRAGFFDASQNLRVTNTISGTTLLVGEGLIGAPSIAFADAPGTGMWKTAGVSDIIDFSLDGVRALRIRDNSILSFGRPFWTNTDGTAGAPSFSWLGDNNTGLFNSSADVLGITAGGTERVTISGLNDSTDGMGIDGNLTITGTIAAVAATFADSLTVSGIPVSLSDVEGITDIVQDLTPQLGGDLDANGKNILIADGSVGTPSIQFASDSDTGISRLAEDAIQFSTGGTAPVVFSSTNLFLLPQIVSNLGSATAPQFSFLSSANTGMYGPAVGSLAFSTGGVAAGRFDGSQNFHANADVLASGTVSGTIIQAGDGSAANPSIRFNGDDDTGLYLNAPGQLDFTVNAGLTLRLQGDGIVLYEQTRHNESGSATSPSYTFSSNNSTGIYIKATKVLGLTAGGNETLTVSGVGDSTDGVGIDGNLTVTGTVEADIGQFNTALNMGTAAAGALGVNTSFIYAGGDASTPGYSWLGDTDTGLAHGTSANTVLMRAGNSNTMQWTNSLIQSYKIHRFKENGTATAPSIQFIANTDTGLYQLSNGDDTLAFTTAGVAAGHFDADQNLHVTNDMRAEGTVSGTDFKAADGTAANPAYTFSSDTDTGLILKADGDVRMIAGGTEVMRWKDGICHAIVPFRLDSGSSAAAPAFLFHLDTDTGIYQEVDGDDAISFTTGGTRAGFFDSSQNLIITNTVSGTNVVAGAGTVGAPAITLAGGGFGGTNTGLYATAVDRIRMSAAGVLSMEWKNGAVTSFGQMTLKSSASVTNPALRFLSDTNVGLYQLSDGDDTLAFTTGGVRAGYFDGSQDFHADNDVLVSGTVTATSGTFSDSLTVSGIPVSLSDVEGITDIVQDLTPQLGGNLDVNGKSITSASDGDIDIQPDGTGGIQLYTGIKQFNVDNTSIWIVASGGGDIALDTVSSNEGGIFIQAGTAGASLETFDGGKLDILGDGFIDIVAENRVKIKSNVDAIALESTVEISINAPIAGDKDADETAPAYSFSLDSDTGMYLHSGNVLGFAGAGRTIVTISGIAPVLPQDERGMGIDGNLTVTGTVLADVGSYDTSVQGKLVIGGFGDNSGQGEAGEPQLTFATHLDSGFSFRESNGIMYSHIQGFQRWFLVASTTGYTGFNAPLRLWNFASPGSAGLETALCFQNDRDTGWYQDENSWGSNSGRIRTSSQNVAIMETNPGGVEILAGNLTVVNDVIVSGTVSGMNVTASGQFLADVGSAAAPSFAFTDDPNTGLFNVAADRLRIVAGGQTGIEIDTTNVEVFRQLVLKTDGGTVGAPALTFAGDQDTGIYQDTDDVIEFACGGSRILHLHIGADNFIEADQQIRGITGSASRTSFAFDNDLDSGMYQGLPDGFLSFATAGVRAAFIDGSQNWHLTNDMRAGGVVSGTKFIVNDGGTGSDTAIQPVGDPDTGIHFPTANAMTFECGDVGVLTLNASSAIFGRNVTFNKLLIMDTSVLGTGNIVTVFNGDTDTGFFQHFPGQNDTIAFATGGIEAGYFDASQNLNVSADVIASGTISGTDFTAEDGTAGNPSYTFTNDPDTGVFLLTPGTMRFVTSGSVKLQVTNSDVRIFGPLTLKDGTDSVPSIRWSSDVDTGFYQNVAGDGSIAFTTDGTRAGYFDANQNLIVEGTVSGTTIEVENGSVSAPSYTFGNHTNTGMYSTASNGLRFAIKGIEKFTVGEGISTSVVRMQFPSGSASTPSVIHISDANTGLYFPSNDVVGFTAGGTETLTISGVNDSTDGVGIEGNLTVTSTVGADVVSANRFTAADNGSLTLPALNFANDTNAGLFLVAPGFVGMSIGGTNVTQWANGSVSFGNVPVLFKRVTGESSPAIQFANDTDTGIYADGANTLAFTTGGTEAGFFDASQNLHVTNDIRTLGTVSGTEVIATGTAQADIFLAKRNVNGDWTQPGFSFQDDPDTGLHLDGVGDLRILVGGSAKFAFQPTAIIPQERMLHNETGTAAAASYSFNGSANTGMYLDATNVLGLSAGGTEKLTISGVGDSTDGVGIKGNLTVASTIEASTKIVAPTIQATTISGTTSTFGVDNDATNFLAPQMSFVPDSTQGTKKSGFGYNYGAHYPFMTANDVLTQFWTASYTAVFKQFRVYTWSPQGVTVPAFSFQQDTDTGMFQIVNGGDNNCRFATGGVEAGRWDEAQNLHVTNDMRAGGVVSGTVGIYDDGLTVSGVPVATGTVVDEGQIVFLAQMFG